MSIFEHPYKAEKCKEESGFFFNGSSSHSEVVAVQFSSLYVCLLRNILSA